MNDHPAQMPPDSRTDAQALRAEQVRLLYTSAPAALAATLVCAMALAAVEWDVSPRLPLQAWLAFMAALTAFRYILARRFRDAPPEQQTRPHWHWLFLAGAALSGAGWGATIFLLRPESSTPHQVFLVFVLGGITAGAVSTLSARLDAFLCFALPVMAAVAGHFLLSPDPLATAMAGMVFFFTSVMIVVGARVNRAITRSLGLQFENAGLLARTAEHAHQIERTAAALRRSEELYRALYHDTPAMHFTLSPEGTVLSVNHFGAHYLGYSPKDLIGRPVSLVIHDEDMAMVRRQLAACLQQPGQIAHGEFRGMRKDGSLLWIKETARAAQAADDTPAVLLVCEDITQRKRAEDELAAGEHRLRTILDAEPECVKVLAEDGTLLDMNPAGLAMIEADSLAQVRGRSVLSLVAPGHQEAFADFNRRVYAGEAGTMQFDIVGLKGTPRTMETHAVPFRDQRNRIHGVLAVARDITERKRAEEKLSLFQEIITNANDPISVMDLEGRFTYQNPAHASLVGFSDDELLGKTPALFLGNDVFAAIVKELGSTQSYRGEVLLHTKGGALRDLDLSVFTIRDAAGKPSCFVAIKRDITERKRAEERLKAASLQLETVIQTSPLAIVSLDATGGRVVRWSRAAEVMFGWREDEILGQPLPFVPPGLEDESEAIWDQAVRDGFLRGIELQRMRKDGTLLDIALWATIVKDAEGRVTDTFGILEDITDRKRINAALQNSERALRRSIRERERLARNLHDNIIQSIYAIGFTLEECQRLVAHSPKNAEQKMSQVIAALNRVIREVRGYLTPDEEGPETLSANELVASLEHLGGLMEQAKGMRFTFAIDPAAAESLSPARRAQLLYVAQEAMSNSLRHSGAAEAHVMLSRTPGGVKLEIRDNGIGFKPQENGQGGLRNMQARALKIGARLAIQSQRTHGTIVSLEVPDETCIPAREA